MKAIGNVWPPTEPGVAACAGAGTPKGAPVAPGVEWSAGGSGTLAFVGGALRWRRRSVEAVPGVEFGLRRLHIRLTGFGRGGTPHIRQFDREFSELG